MATIARYAMRQKDQFGNVEVMFRVTYSREVRFRIHTGITINPDRFADGRIKMPRLATPEAAELRRKEQDLGELEMLIYEYMGEGIPTKGGIDAIVRKYHKPKKTNKQKNKSDLSDFFLLWNEFIGHKEISSDWATQYSNLMRILHRYELYMKLSSRSFKMSASGFDANSFVRFYREEPVIFDSHPEIYNDYPASLRPQHKDRKPQARGDNAVCNIVKKLTAFFNWCVREGKISKSPMGAYKGVREEIYGKPVYLTIEERDALYRCDMSHRPQLAKQRDVFVFQCLIGCRIGDLYALSRNNISDGMLQYVPGKTRKERAEAVRVPLTPTAIEILERYKDGPTLLPLISQQRYNEAIKEACRVAGLDRMVTVINPTTGVDERKPIWQVASSHMARRTFVGNLYKKVKDPNLVGSLSGHKEGSRAFARYRDIDDDIRRDVMSLLD